MAVERDEKGSAAIWMCALCAVCLLAVFGVTELGKAQILKVKVQNAADASALSAAYDIANYKSESACQSAKRAADKNNAVLTSCRADDNHVEVELTDKEGIVQARAKAKID